VPIFDTDPTDLTITLWILRDTTQTPTAYTLKLRDAGNVVPLAHS
jgi:hypothetical protein